jgi:hypothetical protein
VTGRSDGLDSVRCILFTFRISPLIAFVNLEFLDNTAIAARFTTSDFSDLDADLNSSKKALIVMIVSLVNTAEGMLKMGYLLKVMRKFKERVTYRFEEERQWLECLRGAEIPSRKEPLCVITSPR